MLPAWSREARDEALLPRGLPADHRRSGSFSSILLTRRSLLQSPTTITSGLSRTSSTASSGIRSGLITMYRRSTKTFWP